MLRNTFYRPGMYPMYILIVFVFVSSLFFVAVSPARAMQLQLTFQDITQKADLIFLGTVVDQETRYGPNQNMIFTDVHLDVEKLVYNNKKAAAMIGQTVILTFAGGEIGGETVKVSDVPSFETGTNYLIFTRMDGKTYASPVIGSYQGLFKIVADEVTGSLYPLAYGGRCIVGIGEHDLAIGPPVARVISGEIEVDEKSEGIPFTFHAVAPEPAEGVEHSGAVARVSVAGQSAASSERKKPDKIVSLDEFLSDIQKRIKSRKEGR